MPRRKGARGRGGGVRKRGASNSQISVTNETDNDESRQVVSFIDGEGDKILNDSMDAIQGNEDDVSDCEEGSSVIESGTETKSDINEASRLVKVIGEGTENVKTECLGMQVERGGDEASVENTVDNDETSNILCELGEKHPPEAAVENTVDNDETSNILCDLEEKQTSEVAAKNEVDNDEMSNILCTLGEKETPEQGQEAQQMDVECVTEGVEECEAAHGKDTDADISIEVEEDVQFVDKEADDDEVQYIDDEADEEQQLLDVMVSTSEDKSEASENKDETARKKISEESEMLLSEKQSISRTRSSSVRSKPNEDNKFEEISEGSIGQSEQEEVINEASNFGIGTSKCMPNKDENEGNSKNFIPKGKTRIPYKEAESLEEVFFATENDDVKITAEDKDNDEISDASLTDHEDANLSLEEISDDDLEVSKRRRKSSGPGLNKIGGDEKIDESGQKAQPEAEHQRQDEKTEKDQGHGSIPVAQKRSLSEQECSTDVSTMKKLKLSSEKIDTEENPVEKENEPVFFTGICKDANKDSTTSATQDPDVTDTRNTSLSIRKLSQASRNERQGSRDNLLPLRDNIEMRRRYEAVSSSTQTEIRQQKGKIVQCNINPVKQSKLSGPDREIVSDGDVVSNHLEKFRKQLPASIPPQIFKDITSLPPAIKDNSYSFSMGPVTLSDMDSPAFREVVLRRAEKFSLTFDKHSQGIFKASLSKNEELTELIQQLKKLEMGNRYMVMSVMYKHGEGVKACLWKATLVFMYEQDIQKEIQGLFPDGKVKAKLSLKNVPKGLSKDFINLLFPEALSVSTGPGLDRVVTLGFSSSKMVEEILSCYDLVVLNGSEISLSEIKSPADRSLETCPVADAGIIFTEDNERMEEQRLKDIKDEEPPQLQDNEPGTDVSEKDVKMFTPAQHKVKIRQSPEIPTNILKEETVVKSDRNTATVSTEVIAKVITEKPINEARKVNVEVTDNVKVSFSGDEHISKSSGDVKNEEKTQSHISDNSNVSVPEESEEAKKDLLAEVEIGTSKPMEVEIGAGKSMEVETGTSKPAVLVTGTSKPEEVGSGTSEGYKKPTDNDQSHSTVASSKDPEVEEIEKVLETLPTSVVSLSSNEPRQDNVGPTTSDTENENVSVEVRVENIITAGYGKEEAKSISQSEVASHKEGVESDKGKGVENDKHKDVESDKDQDVEGLKGEDVEHGKIQDVESDKIQDVESDKIQDVESDKAKGVESGKSQDVEGEKITKENLEDVSDEEMMNQSKEIDGEDVVILKEDPSEKTLTEIDLTKESLNQEGHATDGKSKLDATERTEKTIKQLEEREKRSHTREFPKEDSKKKMEGKLMMTDGSLEISMEVVDVSDNEAEPEILYPRKLQEPRKMSADRQYTDRDLSTSRTETFSKEPWIVSSQPPRPEPYHSSRSPLNAYSSKGMTYKYYHPDSPETSSRARVPSRESTAQRRDKFHRELARSRTPSPRKESSWYKESEVYKHSRPRHTLDYPYTTTSSDRKYTSHDHWGKDDNWRPSHHGESNKSESYTRTRPEPDDRRWEWQEIHSSSHHSSRAWPKDSHGSGKPTEHYSYSSSRGPEHSQRKYYSRRSRSRSQSFSDLSMFSDSRSSMRRKPSYERRGPKDTGKHTSRSPISVSSRSHSLSPVSKSPSFERSQPKEDKDELVHSVKQFLHLAKGLHATEKRRIQAKSYKSPPPPHHSRSPRPMRSYSPRQASPSPPPPPHCHVIRHSPPPRMRTRSPQRKRSRSPHPSWSRNSRSPEYIREQNIRSYRSPSPVDVRKRRYKEHHYVSSRGDREVEMEETSKRYDSHRSRRHKDESPSYERERSRSRPRQWPESRSSDQRAHSGDRQRQQSYGAYQGFSSSSSMLPNPSNTYNPSYPPPGFPHGTNYPPPPQQQSYLGGSTPMYQYNTSTQYGYSAMPPRVPDPYTVRTQPPPMTPNYQQSYSVMQSTLSGPPPSHSYAPSSQTAANTASGSSADKSSSKNKKTWSMGSNAMVFQRILGSDGDKKKKMSGVIEQIGDRERHERPKQTKEVRVLTNVPVHRR